MALGGKIGSSDDTSRSSIESRHYDTVATSHDSGLSWPIVHSGARSRDLLSFCRFVESCCIVGSAEY